MLALEKIDRLNKNPAYQQFKVLLKRRLGYPVIKIELDDVNIDLAIWDAIRKYQREHLDGSENLLIPVQVTPEIIQQGYVEFPDTVIGINKLFDFQGFAQSLFSMDFIMASQASWEAFRASGSLQSYVGTMQYLSNVRDIIRSHPRIRFTYTSGKCYFDMHRNKLASNGMLMFDTLVAIDPEHNHRIYEDPWLTEYAIALIKIAWGQVLKKYQDVPLPGGIKMNGEAIFNEGKEAKEKLEEELHQRYQMPPMFIIG